MAAGRTRRDAHGSCNAQFDDRPDEYDALRSAGHMARRRAEHFAAVVGGTSGAVLELGSGTGTLLRALAARYPDRRFVGVEPIPGYVEFATQQARAAGLANVRFVVGTGEGLSSVVQEDDVRLLVSVDALHHVGDMAATAREASRVVVPGGRWHAMEPNRLHPYVWLYHTLTPGERTFPVGEFLAGARGAGWRLEHRTSRYLVPSGVRRLPDWAARVELRGERLLPLAGAVVLDLVNEGSGPPPVNGARGR